MTASAQALAAPRALWQHPAFAAVLGLALAAALTQGIWWDPLARTLTGLELRVGALVGARDFARLGWGLLPLAALAAGVVASLSPCILPLVPLQLACIGAAGAQTRRAAAALSASFVLGAALALSLLGLAGDLAGRLLIAQRGFVLVAVGLGTLYLALVFLELARLPGAGFAPGSGRRSGPFAAGAFFALATTPCASPLLAGVLAAATASGVAGLGAASLFSFSLGYTALVFFAGVFGGGALARVRRRSFEAPRAAGAALLLVAGLGLLTAGVRWF